MDSLLQGERYYVVTNTQAGNYQWVTTGMIADYLGRDMSGEWQFSLRPLGGTIHVRPDTVMSAEPTTLSIQRPFKV